MYSVKINEAMAFAKKYHDMAGQIEYFETHLMDVFNIAVDYYTNHSYYYKVLYDNSLYRSKNKSSLSEKDFIMKLADRSLIVCLLHDVLEDCGSLVTINDIINNFGDFVGENVYRLTDPAGKNRKERKLKGYSLIRGSDTAVEVKLFDRISNVRRCLNENNKYYKMYKDEYYTFKAALWDGEEVCVGPVFNVDHNKYLWDQLDKLHWMNNET